MVKATATKGIGKFTTKLRKRLNVKPGSFEVESVDGNGTLRASFSEVIGRKFPEIASKVEGTSELILEHVETAVEPMRCDERCKKAKKILAKALGVPVGCITMNPVGNGVVSARFKDTVLNKHRNLNRTFVGSLVGLFELAGIPGAEKRVLV